MRKRIIALSLLISSLVIGLSFLVGFILCDLAFGENILLDDGSWNKQKIKIQDLDTGKTKKVRYRIYGVNRDRVKIYEDGKIKRYKIKK